MIPRIVIALVLVLAAVPVAAETSNIAFETIPLKHALPCDLAPLLGSQFRYANELAKWAAGSSPPPATDFPGISILTAAHPTARAILAAGTPEAIGELRAFVQALDVPQPLVRITADVYPSAPGETQGWTELEPAVGGVSMYARALGHRARLSFPALPAGFRPSEIAVTAVKRRPEFIPLPLYSGFPQVLLGVATDLDGRGQIFVGYGVLATGGKPLNAVRAASSLRRTAPLSPGERLALRLERGRAAVTIILATDTRVSPP